MKVQLLKFVSFLGLLSFCLAANAQTQFWFENWLGTTCNQGCTTYTGINGTWTVNTSVGTNGSNANTWFFSKQEAAMGRTKCGTTGTVTAHVGNVSTSPNAFLYCPTGDCGAAYDAGACDGTVVSNQRLESPTINCTGKSTITLTLNYIMNGDATDLCTPYYYNGSTWTALTSFTRKTCLLGQGKWQYYSVSLPASANNNANVKIGFYWTNDDDCLDFSDADPSFAVDSIQMLYSVLLPIQLTNFTAEYNNSMNAVALNWATATETNNAYFTVERSADGETFSPVLTQKGAGNSTEPRYYSAIDESILGGVVYYRLKQTDYDGNYSYSNIVAVNESNVPHITIYPNPATSSLNVNYHAMNASEQEVFEVIDCTGREMMVNNIVSVNKGDNTYSMDISRLSKGIYMLKVITPAKTFYSKFIKE